MIIYRLEILSRSYTRIHYKNLYDFYNNNWSYNIILDKYKA